MSPINWQRISGPPSAQLAIVYLHGWLEDYRQWNPVTTNLRRAPFAQYTIDLPGHGENTTRFSHQAVQHSAKELAKAIKLAPEKKFIVAGYSLGGVVGTTAVALHPDKIMHNIVGCSPNYRLVGNGLIYKQLIKLIDQVQAQSDNPAWVTRLQNLGKTMLKLPLPKQHDDFANYRTHLENFRRNLELMIAQNRPERIYMYLQFAKELLNHNVFPLLMNEDYQTPTTHFVLKGDAYNRMANAYRMSSTNPVVNLKVLTKGFHHQVIANHYHLLADYIRYLARA